MKILSPDVSFRETNGLIQKIHCARQFSQLWGESDTSMDRNDSTLDPAKDPDEVYDMYESWHHPEWAQGEDPDGAGW
ncbi:hypothetical protein GUITHDRAFT_101595 [Guillardia theta CCMP2712]|uniref:Uncharacterized protein n=1 Tax=Guillardia theta (strain CCMP2712) TaxID=905079 RepID=L1JWF2_GUITC|nr:hypothetical protein GUITHDRAFT_101595 [Guillardia theta CCMP2712]EKX52423.1 hypothetical protein GUITHDRAFT_101595 [Guillardia theta CCMP2712]|eukprot:XP_005839403.1 hypothetical protein GUITHDRAFT_101595 [Guillardia theta CCMP2712]